MVYCGKPSRGCQMCRTRRIKCDETKPTCNQCAKSRRHCPGYKDEFDLVFRNETQATERRARKANRKAMEKMGKELDSPVDSESNSLSPQSTSTAITIPTPPMDGSMSPLELLLPALNMSVEEQASCHFVSNYVLLPRQGSTRGYMEFLLPLLKADKGNHHLRLAFEACSLASLGNRPNARGSGAAERALKQYTKAIKSTYVALQDPEMGKSDATLAAILMLGLFENISATEVGMLAWGSHTEGAVQLVKARGRKQLRTKTGLLLFISVRTQMIIYTITSGKSPIMGVDWWLSDAVKDEAAARCQRLNIRTSELRAEVNRLMTNLSRTPENIELVLDVVRRAQLVDHDLLEWMTAVPEHYAYRTVSWVDNVTAGDYATTEAFPGRVDIYRDIWTAAVWNLTRVARLIISSVVVRCSAWVCNPVDYRTTPEYAAAARASVDTITDIIASVPYHLGWHLKRPEVLRKVSLSAFPCGEEDHQKALAGYFLTWPLTAVKGQDYTTDAQRTWIDGRLKHIGDEMGVKYAYMLAKINIRIPSMLIRRDGLMAQPYPNAANFEKLLSARSAPPTTGYSMNPLLQREAMQKEYFEQRKAELVAKATGDGRDATRDFFAAKWLSI